MRRKLLTFAGFVSGALAGTMLYRRSLGRRADRLDVYYEDGSMVSYSEGSPGADRLLDVARRLLATAKA